ncbi:uncharacterized protein LOC122368367 [Amphibalanus amphitrite]|uniref:uncharacterized protein LOC122368367 n=1 Tax=Amphibalanus amphitrite TaxID=1232801 RepID=UPI001C908262|nr:uncharacterized protein LOC122368367 [Amphibalanus amphitrite]
MARVSAPADSEGDRFSSAHSCHHLDIALGARRVVTARRPIAAAGPLVSAARPPAAGQQVEGRDGRQRLQQSQPLAASQPVAGGDGRDWSPPAAATQAQSTDARAAPADQLQKHALRCAGGRQTRGGASEGGLPLVVPQGRVAVGIV